MHGTLTNCIITQKCVSIILIGYITSSPGSDVDDCLTEFDERPTGGNGPVRLWRNGVTSPDFTSGIVQLYFDDQWGNICDDFSFRSEEANVVCRQLGYTGASSYDRASDGSM